ncbi:MAG: FAD-dependent oxidoreductase, partial [Erysipelotrichaceae bacterium]|nr:FAD-dependent oxidoreductase [Erysipelotrichaceae bacterium]
MKWVITMYDLMIIGAGPGGIFTALETIRLNPDCSIAVLEAGAPLHERKCPIDGKKVKSCIHCKPCSIMNGFGGAGAFSDGKYNITNEFGGTLHEYIGADTAMELMEYVDSINCRYGAAQTKLYENSDPTIAKKCLQHNLHLLKANVRHLGTDI